jgi:hypothetical protein
MIGSRVAVVHRLSWLSRKTKIVKKNVLSTLETWEDASQ